MKCECGAGAPRVFSGGPSAVSNVVRVHDGVDKSTVSWEVCIIPNAPPPFTCTNIVQEMSHSCHAFALCRDSPTVSSCGLRHVRTLSPYLGLCFDGDDFAMSCLFFGIFLRERFAMLILMWFKKCGYHS